MTEQEAIERAIAAAQQYYDLANYQAPDPMFSVTKWLVLFQKTSNMPGEWFMVTVDDQTGATDVRGGY